MPDGFRDYLQSIGRIALLTPAEEIMLGTQIQEWLAADPEAPNYRRLSRIGKRAKKRMFTANLRLVVDIAKKYQSRIKTMDLEDVVQEGNIGLDRAIDKFDPARGYKFSTYAYWWIRQSVTRSISYQDRAIRLPGHVYTDLGKVFSRLDSGTVTVKELAKDLDRSEDYIRDLMQSGQKMVSLDKPATSITDSKGRGADLVDMIAGSDDPEHYVETQAQLDMIKTAFGHLTDQQREVLELHMGLIPGKEPMTFSAIAKEWQLSRERIRQIYCIGLRRLRYFLAYSTGESYDDNLYQPVLFGN